MKFDATAVSLYSFVLGIVRLVFLGVVYCFPQIKIEIVDNHLLQAKLDEIGYYLMDPIVQCVFLGFCIFQLVAAMFLLNGIAEKKTWNFWPFSVFMFLDAVTFLIVNYFAAEIVCIVFRPKTFEHDVSVGKIVFNYMIFAIVYFILAIPYMYYQSGLREIVSVDYKKTMRPVPNKLNKTSDEPQSITVV